jgi:hypothetical protein
MYTATAIGLDNGALNLSVFLAVSYGDDAFVATVMGRRE